jgi:RsiW-degrading membrane proteinase PrsW (M82 family)
MGALILYATLGLCAVGAAFLVYRHDLYDREPWSLLAVAVGLGAAAIVLAGWLEAWTFVALSVARPAGQAAVAAACEELGKLLVVVAFAFFARRTFNDPMDGIVYGSMAGLGAALDESVALLRGSSHGLLLPPEELVRLCGHLVMGGLGGFAVGMARIGKKGWPAAVVGGFLAAFALHFGWDFMALSAETREPSLGQTLARVATMLAGLVGYGLLLELGARWSKQVFAPDLPVRPAGKFG